VPGPTCHRKPDCDEDFDPEHAREASVNSDWIDEAFPAQPPGNQRTNTGIAARIPKLAPPVPPTGVCGSQLGEK
jgi:hypothetical protein